MGKLHCAGFVSDLVLKAACDHFSWGVGGTVSSPLASGLILEKTLIMSLLTSSHFTFLCSHEDVQQQHNDLSLSPKT